MKEYACRRCKAITTGKVCPVCKSADLSADWYGLVLVVNPEESRVARLLNITQKGKYALKVT
ncbi:MAG: transcription elongation factor subunit Spt4 [Candidatus Nitrosocaldus sp.]|nr:DNA-directed RNA polymerase, subunit E'' [Candidatus Nitrosocaldus sp.]MCS7141056.1 DNA-directed RNA polymerase, subunit E'' [Candidatus Nitrosocaldus sp.]MDW8000020.1 transcription elongation factor subunit Spt4 [Candidatus Nitrosocaldus sp.]MDW8275929.1 transcription elongation factor subunit Spt4 [Candidatus Nitrosocaldus sp.]